MQQGACSDLMTGAWTEKETSCVERGSGRGWGSKGSWEGAALSAPGLCGQGSSWAVFAALQKGTFYWKPMVSHFRGARAKCWRADQPLTTSHNSPQQTPAQVREACGKILSTARSHLLVSAQYPANQRLAPAGHSTSTRRSLHLT